VLSDLAQSEETSSEQTLLHKVRVSLTSNGLVVSSVTSQLGEGDGAGRLGQGSAVGLVLTDLKGVTRLGRLKSVGSSVDQARVRLLGQSAQVSGLSCEGHSISLLSEGGAICLQERKGQISRGHWISL